MTKYLVLTGKGWADAYRNKKMKITEICGDGGSTSVIYTELYEEFYAVTKDRDNEGSRWAWTIVEDVEDTEEPLVSYYHFPGGVQVLDISRHLTSNAGQVVQYVARSSRLDGLNKGDVLGDLKKAKDLLEDEIARLS